MSDQAEGLQEIYEKRESWCLVERHPTQSWCRRERKHFPQHLQTVLNERPGPSMESRSTWTNITPRHREKRHFPDAGKWMFKVESTDIQMCLCLTYIKDLNSSRYKIDIYSCAMQYKYIRKMYMFF